MRGSQGWFARCPSPAPSLTHLPSRRQGQRRQRQARVCGPHRPTGVGYAVQGGRGHVPRHCSTFDLALIVVSPVMSSPLAVSLGWRPFACRRQQCHGEPSVGHESEEHRLRDIEAQSGALAHRHDRATRVTRVRGCIARYCRLVLGRLPSVSLRRTARRKIPIPALEQIDSGSPAGGPTSTNE